MSDFMVDADPSGALASSNWAERAQRAEAKVLMLMKALEPFAEPGVRLSTAACHVGIFDSPEECSRCSKIIAARAALTEAEAQ